MRQNLATFNLYSVKRAQSSHSTGKHAHTVSKSWIWLPFEPCLLMGGELCLPAVTKSIVGDSYANLMKRPWHPSTLQRQLTVYQTLPWLVSGQSCWGSNKSRGSVQTSKSWSGMLSLCEDCECSLDTSSQVDHCLHVARIWPWNVETARGFVQSGCQT